MFNFITLLAASCTPKGGGFLGFPTWYKYLPGVTSPNGANNANVCLPKVGALSDVWLIVAAILEILLRLAGFAAIIFVIYGGVQYVTSQGEPDKANRARQTLINALTGLVIAISATILVTYVAGRFN
jgi:ABC-type Fe3+ transport system permease subunit